MREASEELDRLFDMYIRNLRLSFGDDAADDHIDSLMSALNESSRRAMGDFDDDDDDYDDDDDDDEPPKRVRRRPRPKKTRERPAPRRKPVKRRPTKK